MRTKKKEPVKLPAHLRGSEVVELKVEKSLNSLLPRVENAEIFELKAEHSPDDPRIIVIHARLASAGETFWVDGVPYKGATAETEE